MGLFDLFSSKPAKEAAAAKAAGLRAGLNTANTAIDTGLGQSLDFYDRALVPFSQLYDRAMPGYDLYGDATGAGGQEGLDRARALFTQTPGYREALDRSVDAVTRAGAARGVATGNTLAEVTKLASDYANDRYGDFVGRLAPYLQAGQGAATGQAGVLTGAGDTAFRGGAAKADYGFRTHSGIGDANAQAALAPYNASANLWGTLLGGAKLLSGFGGWGGGK